MRSARFGMRDCSTFTRTGYTRPHSIIMSSSRTQSSLSKRCSRWSITSSIPREPTLSSNALDQKIRGDVVHEYKQMFTIQFSLRRADCCFATLSGVITSGFNDVERRFTEIEQRATTVYLCALSRSPGSGERCGGRAAQNHCTDETARTWLFGNSYLPFDQGCAPVLHSLALGGSGRIRSSYQPAVHKAVCRRSGAVGRS